MLAAVVWSRDTSAQLSARIVKLVHLGGFIIKIFVTMHGHMNVKVPNNYNCKFKFISIEL